jgi:hypothetical protein
LNLKPIFFSIKFSSTFEFPDIKSMTTTELLQIIDSYNITTAAQSRDFSHFYYNLMMTSPDDHMTYMAIAKVINSQLPEKVGIKSFLISFVTLSFAENAFDFDDKSRHEIKTLMASTKYLGGLYVIEWMSKDVMLFSLKSLTGDGFESSLQVDAFYELLKIAGTKMVADGVDLRVFYIQLQGKLEKVNNVFEVSKLEVVLELIDDIWRVSSRSKGKVENINEIRRILKDIRHDNIKDTAESVKNFEFFTFDKITEAFVEISVGCYENGQFYAELLAEIGDLACQDITGTKHHLRERILASFELEFKSSVESMDNTKILAILWIVSNLYNHKVITKSRLNFYITTLQALQDDDDLDLDVINMLVATTKFKIDTMILGRFLDDIGFTQLTVNSETDAEMAFIESIEDFGIVENLSDDLKIQILDDEKTMKKFVEAIAVFCEINPQLTPKSIEFCQVLCKNQIFSRVLSSSVKSRGFIAMVQVNESLAHPKLFKNSVTLITHLYRHELITFDALRPWLSSPMASKFTYNELLGIVDTIKCNSNDDVEVKIHHIQSIMHEKLIEMCDEIKTDLRGFGEGESVAVSVDCDVD